MKKSIFFILALTALFIGCKNSKSGKAGLSLVTSSGPINSLSIIVNDSLWKGAVGERLRDVLAAPVTGLPQDEPIFSLNHIPPRAFSDLEQTSRIFVKIDCDRPKHFEIVHDTFAEPQTGVFISGPPESIMDLVTSKSHEIISALKRTEIQAEMRSFTGALKNTALIESKFGVNLRIPSSFRFTAQNEPDFVWLRKDINKPPYGDMDILVYQVPMAAIDKGNNVIGNIVKMRDSIGKKYIPGPQKGSYMITEKAYAPYLFETKVDGRFTYLTKGNWEVKGTYMTGPFINYAVRDKANDRYMIFEGFVFRPQVHKRDYMFELKAIIHSADIK